MIPITDSAHDYRDDIFKTLQEEDIRVEVDKRNEKLQYKIREGELNKVPYMLIIGDREKEARTVSLRARKEGNLGAMKIEDFVERIKTEVKNKV